MNPSRCRGMSLISLMVGLFIGLFSLLSMVNLYKVQAKQTVQTKSTNRIDGQISLGLVVAQMEMQKAGFGVEADTDSCEGASTPGRAGTVNRDFVMLSGAAISEAGVLTGTGVTINPAAGTLAAGNALVWRWNDGTNNQCSGIVSQGGGLKLLQEVVCSDATQWGTLTWAAAKIKDVVSAGTLNADKKFGFSAQMASCAPYGRSAPAEVLLVTTTVGQSMNAVTVTNDVCIPNICKN